MESQYDTHFSERNSRLGGQWGKRSIRQKWEVPIQQKRHTLMSSDTRWMGFVLYFNMGLGGRAFFFLTGTWLFRPAPILRGRQTGRRRSSKKHIY